MLFEFFCGCDYLYFISFLLIVMLLCYFSSGVRWPPFRTLDRLLEILICWVTLYSLTKTRGEAECLNLIKHVVLRVMRLTTPLWRCNELHLTNHSAVSVSLNIPSSPSHGLCHQVLSDVAVLVVVVVGGGGGGGGGGSVVVVVTCSYRPDFRLVSRNSISHLEDFIT